MLQWEQEYKQELEDRVRRLEEDPQALPPRFSPRDYALVIGAVLLCLAGVLWGAFL